MRDKSDDMLAPPAVTNMSTPMLVTPDASKFIMRKKPHTLPPLEKFRSLEGRGSPVPQARRRSSIEEQLLQEDGQVIPAEGRPLIRLTKCSEDPPSIVVGGGGGPGGGGGGLSQRLPPPKQGSTPAAAVLAPLGNRYTPLQPIRRTGDHSQ
ncbi:uncharacterized protein LOC117654492 [Thrips palmi]|uniref:Uncharacterized protein LOC117654492 n=1 Tax=Thrips palmi TaxID=161013 RepID=A0A6P9AI34_THRPL|nr:uncharacterized protein LOC117654492 [Thrips palmi]